MLEIKAKSTFAPEDYVQAESYVKAAGYALGLLINFGGLKIQIKRIINQSGHVAFERGSRGTAEPAE